MKIVINSLDNFGRGIGKYNDKVVFIPYTLVGEEVEFEIVLEKKKFIEGKLIKVLKESENRIKSSCPYFGLCGGCQLLHMSYDDEILYKENKMKDIIKRYVGDYKVNNIIKSEREGYRNKVTFQVDKEIGFYKNKTNEVIKIDKCLLLNDKVNSVIKDLKPIGDQIQVKYSNYDDTIMINDEPKYIISKIGKYKFKVSPKSFFQVNYKQVENLYNKVVEYAKLTGNEKVLDLYCGTGTIGIYLSEYAKEVLGVELSSDAVNDANINKEMNKANNISFICSDTNKIVTSKNFIPDVIVVDPPRSGLTDKVIKEIIKLNPKRLVYVSCDPMTLARDLNELKEYFNIIEITPVDMFPGTYHVENVCLLERKIEL